MKNVNNALTAKRANRNTISKEDLDCALGLRDIELPGPVSISGEDFVRLLELIPEKKLTKLMAFKKRNKSLSVKEAVNVRLMVSNKYSKPKYLAA